MLQPLIHGLLLALGLILPLGAQNVFVFNQGANQKISKALPVIITAGLCDTFNCNSYFRSIFNTNIYANFTTFYLHHRVLF